MHHGKGNDMSDSGTVELGEITIELNTPMPPHTREEVRAIVREEMGIPKEGIPPMKPLGLFEGGLCNVVPSAIVIGSKTFDLEALGKALDKLVQG